MFDIYGDKRSGNCYKIELLCHLLNIEHQWHNVDILANETHTPEFLAMNPNGKIPLLVDSTGWCLSESNAILNYLAKDSKFLPSDVKLLAKVQQWQFFEQYSHEPYIAVARYIQLYLGLPDDKVAEYKAKHQGGYKALGVMEAQLAKTPYLIGNECSVADITLYAYSHVAHQGGFNLTNYPNMLNWFKRIEALDGYVAMTQ
ncbi:glutathione S-transferase family protein [Thalassotalea sp. LPB0316]|uniref:glutathione S-transferase family protein n=1 Tax=Thalassotalea sp. LPB0316 TaxID=2769490 RepID=UPI001868B45E|nr:glutathione S-transferase family protein [Thalassotalea sp. LPB0316]QOL25830.1 glutathione S-transferase family protein [Thalassotalea sp. LPB0316]